MRSNTPPVAALASPDRPPGLGGQGLLLCSFRTSEAGGMLDSITLDAFRGWVTLKYDRISMEAWSESQEQLLQLTTRLNYVLHGTDVESLRARDSENYIWTKFGEVLFTSYWERGREMIGGAHGIQPGISKTHTPDLCLCLRKPDSFTFSVTLGRKLK